ncbi:MAG: inorganic phosphate transporter [Nitrospiraceae bacterium]
MTPPTVSAAVECSAIDHPLEQQEPSAARPIGMVLLAILTAIGVMYIAGEVRADLAPMRSSNAWPFVLLGIALFIALGFEFVNGFHDTANAVATVIYTHTMPPSVAVAWAGVWNFLGVMAASGAVAFGIVALLPVELILQVSAGAGFAMVFALLIAAVIWNVATWYVGLPSSSSHTLIGSVIGVGIMNQLIATSDSGTSGVDWNQAINVGKSLLLSPMVGFSVAAFLLLLCMKAIPVDKLYKPPRGKHPPPWWIRTILIGTCTGVSFAHGSNDGQKGMGLIMLILIGTVPTVYALNRAVEPSFTPTFLEAAQRAETVLAKYEARPAVPTAGDARQQVATYLKTKRVETNTVAAVHTLSEEIRLAIGESGTVQQIPAERTSNVRNDMYMLTEALRHMDKRREPAFAGADRTVLVEYRGVLDRATKFIPTWVKAAVAIALGLGTMIGWKRIVVTVGEKIGKAHLSYGQGACAELTAMCTIGAADVFGLPVSTTHVLSSGVAGTMAAGKAGLQWSTVRNLLMAWVLTFPMSIMLSGGLYWLFLKMV